MKPIVLSFIAVCTLVFAGCAGTSITLNPDGTYSVSGTLPPPAEVVAEK